MSAGESLDEMVAPLRTLREQFVAMTEPHRPALWKYCLRLTGSPWDAEDLVQETMMRAFSRLGNFWQPLASPRAYLFRIASNTWIDTLRRGRVPLDPLEEAQDLAAPDPSPWAGLDAERALERLVALLPPRQRAIVLLVDVFGFPAREVGAMIGATEGAARAALHRARATLEDARTREADAASHAAAAPASASVLARFVDAFNRRDAEAILALLDPQAATDIVGVAEEHGRDVIREQSLAEGMASPIPQRAVVDTIAGEPVVLVFASIPGQPEALAWMIRLETVGGKICTWRAYYFTPELIGFVADRLGVPAMPAGYRYVMPEQPA